MKLLPMVLLAMVLPALANTAIGRPPSAGAEDVFPVEAGGAPNNTHAVKLVAACNNGDHVCRNPGDSCTGVYSSAAKLIKEVCTNEITTECTTSGQFCSQCPADESCAAKYLGKRCYLTDNTEVDCKTDSQCATVYKFPNGISTATTLDVFERGCYSSFSDKCKTGLELHCKFCSKPKCNVNIPLQKLDCVHCDLTSDGCTKLPAKVATRLQGFLCSTKQLNDSDDNTRNIRTGVLTESELKSCQEDDKCKICEGKNCNTAQLPQIRQKCQTTDVCLNVKDTCLGVYDVTGNLVKGGCAKEIVKDCDDVTTFCRDCSKKCEASAGKHSCFVCDSKSDGSTCTIKPATPKTCDDNTDDCFARNMEGSRTVRGCMHFSDKCSGDNCVKCNTDNCNTHNMPTKRMQCHKCQGGANCDLLRGEEKLEPCAEIADECFTKQQDGITTRGCVSEHKDLREDCPEDSCAICKTNACNIVDVRSSTGLCYKCNKDLKGCGYELDGGAIKPELCNGKFMEGKMERCYSFKATEIERGCLSEIDVNSHKYKSCATSVDCNICDTDGCNTHEINFAITIKPPFIFIVSIMFLTFYKETFIFVSL